MPQIFTPLRAKSMQEALATLPKIARWADGVELWLDSLPISDLKALIKSAKMSVLAVCKDPKEGGVFEGGPVRRLEILLEAARAGARYVDLPATFPEKLIKKFVQENGALKKPATLILSLHDFKKTPPLETLLKKALLMRKKGAGIVKIAVQTHSHADTLELVCLARLLQSQGLLHVIIGMGRHGVLSRVLTPFLGGTLMFAPLTSKEATAPGQLTLKELKKAWALIRPNPSF